MINTREIAEEYRLTHWARVIQERSESGLSIKGYCKQIGICGNTYYYWQRRVRQAACEHLLPAVQTEMSKPAIPTGWALVEPIKEPALPIPDSALFIEAGSYRIRVSADTDMELLAKVCRMLVSLC